MGLMPVDSQMICFAADNDMMQLLAELPIRDKIGIYERAAKTPPYHHCIVKHDEVLQ
jgi:hypothetical protein